MILSNLEPNFNLESLTHPPEVSTHRISRVIQFIIDEGNKEIDGYLEENLGEFYQKIKNDHNLWITSEFESKLLEILDKKFNITNHIYNCGKETFLTEAFQILPTDESVLSYNQIFYRTPILLQKHIRYLDFQILEISDNHCLIRVKFTSQENPYDLLFLKGLIRGSAILYQVKSLKIELKQCRFENPYPEIFNTSPPFEKADVPTEILISWETAETKIGKTNLNETSSTPNETFIISHSKEDSDFSFKYIDLDQMVNKLKELYIENRDLEAAVEVLSSLRKELLQKQKAISKDMKMARNIQKGIIPQTIPDWRGLQFAISYLPMQEVSGDYYDYFNFGSNKIGVMISDVSGHGVPAAFITAISKLLFTNYKLDSPSQIFTNANRELIDLVKQQGYLTCFYGIIDSNYTMTYCLAGHPRPLLYKARTNEVVILDGEGTFLGMFTDADKFYKDYQVDLEPGDKLFIYTDGLLEGQSDAGEFFQQNNLIQFIKQTGDMNAQEALKFIMQKFDEFCMGTDQGDDVTLMVIALSPLVGEFEKYKASAISAVRANDFEKAFEELSKARNIFPTDVSILLKLGKYLTKLKRFQEACDFFEDYHNLNSQNAESHFLLGFCYYRLENYSKAEQEFQKAISLRNTYTEPFYYISKLYFKQNNPQKSIEFLEKLLLLDPRNIKANKTLQKLKKKL
ncbi:MAG: SpoIIE family protein phosphatase [Leptospiraceae bacterium]|nr:SpoIIE family protein phosphatase [Leptospiraceae bacterium]